MLRASGRVRSRRSRPSDATGRHHPSHTSVPSRLVALGGAVAAGTVIDGELVIVDPAAGRTSFTALQARVTAGQGLPAVTRARPATLVAFDLLQQAGDLMLDEPLAVRHVHLERLPHDAPPAVTVCSQTTDVDLARQWFTDYVPTGIEGLIIRDLVGRYRTGRGATWWKYKRRTTAEAVVGGHHRHPDQPRHPAFGSPRHPRPPALHQPYHPADHRSTSRGRTRAHRRTCGRRIGRL